MVLEITVGAGALFGATHRLGKLGVIPNYGYERSRAAWPAWLKLVTWGHILAGVAVMGAFDSFESGLLFGLAFIGAWKVAEEAAEVAFDLVETVRRG